MNSGLSESDSEFPVTKVKGLGWERALVQGWGGVGRKAPGRVRGDSSQAGFGVLDGGPAHPSELGKCACYSSG